LNVFFFDVATLQREFQHEYPIRFKPLRSVHA
jgi:hypothetical protein